jgi:hypothetical protein
MAPHLAPTGVRTAATSRALPVIGSGPLRLWRGRPWRPVCTRAIAGAAWWQVAVDRAGHGDGRGRVGVPPGPGRQGGERGVVVLVAAGPGGDVDGAGEQVALVVVAPPVGQHQVLHRVDVAADPRDEMVGFRGAAERPAAVEAPAALQGRDTVPQRRGGRIRSDPNR